MYTGKEYIISFNDAQTVTPLCVVLDGPISPVSPDTGLVSYQVNRANGSHQAAIRSLLYHRASIYICLDRLASVAQLAHTSRPTIIAFRTMKTKTILVVGGSKIEILADQLPTGQPKTGVGHNIDVEGDFRLVLDTTASRLHLLSGRLYLNGNLAAITEPITTGHPPPEPRLSHRSRAQIVREDVPNRFNEVLNKPKSSRVMPRPPRPLVDAILGRPAYSERKTSGGIFVDSDMDLPTGPEETESDLDLRQQHKLRLSETHIFKCVDTKSLVESAPKALAENPPKHDE